jgi:predicted ATPase
MVAENCVLVMKEALLNRFDALDVRVRKVLQTCAVLGNFFALSDLIRVHPELEEIEIEMSLDVATNEMILIEEMEDEEDNVSFYSNSTGGEQSHFGSSTGGLNVVGNRYFRFSHDVSMSASWPSLCLPGGTL